MTAVPPRSGTKGRPNRPGPTQKASQRRQQQRRRNRFLGLGLIGVIVIVAAVLILVASVGSSSAGPLRTPATAAQAQTITSVPMATLVAAAPEAQRLIQTCAATGGCSDAAVAAPSTPTTLAKDGKPTLLFIGAEFCPICATERWPMTIALSHFGTFSNLSTTHSAKNDGDIPTWTYYGSTYTSPYLNFQAYEVETNTDKPLQNPPANLVTLWSTFFGGQEEFPFIDFNQKYVFSTEQLLDSTLEGNSFQTILSSVGDNRSAIGSQIDAAAAVFTHYLCGITGDRPADVCSAVSSLPTTINPNPNGPTSNSGG